MISCRDCIHDGVCYLQEVTNDIEEQLREFGCENYKCATDFVKIIRCKDCKHWNKLEMQCGSDSVATDHEGGASFSLNFYLDDFCSYAEERSGEK